MDAGEGQRTCLHRALVGTSPPAAAAHRCANVTRPAIRSISHSLLAVAGQEAEEQAVYVMLELQGMAAVPPPGSRLNLKVGEKSRANAELLDKP